MAVVVSLTKPPAHSSAHMGPKPVGALPVVQQTFNIASLLSKSLVDVFHPQYVPIKLLS